MITSGAQWTVSRKASMRSMSNIYHIMKKDVRYHKGGFLCARQTGTGWEKIGGGGGQRFGFVRGGFLK
jgi:hypothetical protein